MEFFVQAKPVFIILHALAAAVGLGSVVVTDTLFFRFLKDFRISQKEDDTLRTVSKVVWVIITILFITGLVLYLSAPMDYLAKSKFLVKLVIFCIIVVNGILLNAVITPVLRKIVFGPTKIKQKWGLQIIRHIAFASGALSLTSWLCVFILGSIRSIPVTFYQGVLIYIMLCIVAIAGSQLYAVWMKSHRQEN